MTPRLVRAATALVALALATALPASSGAQARQIPAYRSLVGFNPLGIPFDVISIEGETALQQGITVGGAASYVAWDDDDCEGCSGGERFTSADLKFRYYPGEVVLRGLSVGLSLGLTKYSERLGPDCSIDPRPCQTPGPVPTTRESITSPTIGVLVDYNFLLGAQRRFLVGTGVGAKRLLNRDTDIRNFDPPRAYPFARFAIGLAF